LENNVTREFDRVLREVKPDVVHSFVLYISCSPILPIMQKFKYIPWIYSSWGSDLYYFKNIPKYKKDILRVLPRINYLITDCKRDVKLAKVLGFKNKVLGTFPGGGGFDFKNFEKYITKPASERRTILVKGYQGRSGRSIAVIKALKLLSKELKNYKIIVFGTDYEVIKYCEKNTLDKLLNISIYRKTKFLPHSEILKLMGESLIYIGNSNSDGMPNTLLEAIGMGAFPIQSNPGGASAEVITNNENGLLIQDFDNVDEIKSLIQKGLSSSKLIEKAFIINQMEIKSNYEREKIIREVLACYKKVSEKVINKK
jgi:glycosyltransferase involved in cell wall biosynthesis